MTKTKTNSWIPEIVYEELDDGISSNIPLIQVPENEEMPGVLFIFESRATGEFEPGPEGEELPVTQLDLHQYADMSTLKNNLTPSEYDRVREVLGLEPLQEAVQKGQKITENVRQKLS